MAFDLEVDELMNEARQSLGVSDRGPSGRFARGNTAAVVTGARSLQFWAAAEAHRQAIRAGILADKGFAREQDAPVALRLAADGAAQAQLVRDSAFARMIEDGGPLSGTGRERGPHKIFATNSDRVLRHVQAIGFDRVAQTTQTLEQVMKGEDQ